MLFSLHAVINAKLFALRLLVHLPKIAKTQPLFLYFSCVLASTTSSGEVMRTVGRNKLLISINLIWENAGALIALLGEEGRQGVFSATAAASNSCRNSM